MRPAKFFGIFFCGHLAVSVGYYFLSTQLGSGSGSHGVGGGNVGLGVFGGMVLLFLLSDGQSGLEPTVLPLIFLLNSALTAGVATGIFLVVRRLRAA